MSAIRRHLIHALTGVLAWSLVTGLLVGLGAGAAEAKVPRTAFRYTAAIEPLAGYVGQSTCSPSAKGGTTAFANLLLRTYPRSRSLGISRSCSVGGKSEHKEGRAFDWGMNARNATDRAQVKALLDWLLKADAYGNRYAMARRLGIQYMIWNRRIWGAYSAGSGWRKYTGSNPHTDHVHFSLSWAGARKNTSFWKPRGFSNSSGTPPRQSKPTPDRPSGGSAPSGKHDYPDPRPDEHAHGVRSIPEPRSPRRLTSAAPLTVERVAVLAKSRAGTLTRRSLVAGHRYLVEVTGSYRYALRAGSLADAECSTRPGASWWQRERSLRSDQWNADHLDLYVDGHDLQSQAEGYDDCDTQGHAYRWVYEAQRTGRVPFAVWDPVSYKDNRGKLFVRILDISTMRDSMSWSVPSTERSGATSPGLLRGGKEYRVTVSGTWKNGEGGVADAECVASYGGWSRGGDDYDMAVGDWSYDRYSPNVWGVRSMPVSGAGDCDPGHTYSFVYRPDRTTPLNVRVTDRGRYADNVGALKVTVAPNDGSDPGQPVPTPEPTPEREDLQVDSHSSEPVRTKQEYPAGTSLRVTATGTYTLRGGTGWAVADAECSVDFSDSYWRSSRYNGTFGGNASAPLGDLVVNGVIGTWDPVNSDRSCDRSAHEYTYDLTTTKAGPLWFVLADDDYSDNSGTLDVVVEPR